MPNYYTESPQKRSKKKKKKKKNTFPIGSNVTPALLTIVRILERGITLIYPYSRNKSNYTDLIIFLIVFITE